MSKFSEDIDYDKTAIKVYEDEQRRLKLFQEKVVTKQVQKLTSENQDLKDKLEHLEHKHKDELEQLKSQISTLIFTLPALIKPDGSKKLFSEAYNEHFPNHRPYVDKDDYLIDISSIEFENRDNLLAITYYGKIITKWNIRVANTRPFWDIYQYHEFPMLITNFQQIEFILDSIKPTLMQWGGWGMISDYDGSGCAGARNGPTRKYLKMNRSQ